VADYAPLLAEWEDALGRRAPLRDALGLWTLVLEGWAGWKPAPILPLMMGAEHCRAAWDRGLPLLAEAPPRFDPAALEDLLGPVMERLVLAVPDVSEPFHRFAAAWDEGRVGPDALLPRPGIDPAAELETAFGIPSAAGAFLGPVTLPPALDVYLEGVRGLPDGVWSRGLCPWCSGPPCFGDLVEDGRRRLTCPLCLGAWMAPRLRCPFCDTWDSRDLVRLLGEGMEEGYFIEACRACRGYVKGVDRRQRWNAGSPLVEDWSTPHLDLHALRQGFWRPTPTIAHLLPDAGEPA
jgi:FdhE protein